MLLVYHKNVYLGVPRDLKKGVCGGRGRVSVRENEGEMGYINIYIPLGIQSNRCLGLLGHTYLYIISINVISMAL